MADNVTAGAAVGSGATFASDEIGGAHYLRTKLIHGVDGSNDGDVATGNPLPVEDAAVATALATIDGRVDGLETLIASTNTKLDTVITALGTIDGRVDGLEALLTTQAGFLDGVETLVTSTNTKLDTVIGHVDGVETAIASTNTKLDTENTNSTALAASGSVLDDWDETNRAAVNLIAGQVGVQGASGTVNALTQRMVLATDVGLPAGEAHVGEVGGKTIVKSVTLSTDTSAYASGDLIADTQQIDAFFRKTDGTGVIQTLTIIDEEAQGVAMYVFFHSTNTSMGSENSAPNISDANASAGIQGGPIAIATTDWVTVSGTKVACIRNIGLPVIAASGTDDLYISVLNGSGAPDWDADSLVVKIGALLD